ncbi:hypothetical protein AKO1_007449 [Acrasis kona]|uniref:Uncharacterized protein n=1 Tax=Acrasis kona TaxID=1008807 RepID=A0AAW2YR56_9EUKA
MFAQFWNSNSHNIIVFGLIALAIAPKGSVTSLFGGERAADAKYFVKVRNNLRQWRYW